MGTFAFHWNKISGVPMDFVAGLMSPSQYHFQVKLFEQPFPYGETLEWRDVKNNNRSYARPI